MPITRRLRRATRCFVCCTIAFDFGRAIGCSDRFFVRIHSATQAFVETSACVVEALDVSFEDPAAQVVFLHRDDFLPMVKEETTRTEYRRQAPNLRERWRERQYAKTEAQAMMGEYLKPLTFTISLDTLH